MIVCSCNVPTDHDVRAAIGAEQTPRTTGQAYGCLGCSVQCGRCARTIRRIMDEAIAAACACYPGERGACARKCEHRNYILMSPSPCCDAAPTETSETALREER